MDMGLFATPDLIILSEQPRIAFPCLKTIKTIGKYIKINGTYIKISKKTFNSSKK